jgi:hypothetical protein
VVREANMIPATYAYMRAMRIIGRCRELLHALRDRLEPIPADPEQRIIGWVPAPRLELADPATPPDVLVDELDPGLYADRVTSIRSAAATVIVDQADELTEATPIHDQLVADLEARKAANIRALRTPTAEFWAIVDACNGYHCEHCVAGDHTLCPGCECGCTLVDAAQGAQHA